MASKHRILRQIFELELDRSNVTSGRAEGDFLSAYSANKQSAGLEFVLDRFDLPDKVVRFERIELYLEGRPGESLENVLERTLKAELLRALEFSVQNGESTQLPLTHSDIQIFIFFLENGYLPWNTSQSIRLDELEYRVMEALAVNPEFAHWLAAVLNRPYALERLLFQFSPKLTLRFARALQPDLPLSFEERTQVIPKERALIFWEDFFNKFEQSNLELHQTSQEENVSAKQLEALPLIENTGGIFLGNAGLILLYPYLPALFETLGLLDNGKLQKPGAAVFCLHFAATGLEVAEEWELALPKLLCGLPLSFPIPREEPLTDFHKEEIQRLLEAVVQNWPALKTTSVQSLQHAFFQRAGRIKETESAWQLTVEQQSYDLLLETLPWTIHTVYLSWMSKPIFTEWF